MTTTPVRRCLVAVLVAWLTTTATAQLQRDHHLVLARRGAGSALFDVDPVGGSVAPLRGFALDSLPPLACTWDPIGRHAVVAVDAPLGSLVFRLDPTGPFERLLGVLPDPVVALEIDDAGDLVVLTGGPSGAVWRLPRNGGIAQRYVATPHASALGAHERSPYVWVARSPPAGPPSIEMIEPRTGTVLVAPIAIPALTGRTITGIFDLPTGAIRQVLTDDLGRIHVFEFTTTLRSLAVVPPLPAGATVDLQFEQNASLDVVVLGDARHPYLHRIPVFGGVPGATRLAGPVPGDPVDFDRIDGAGALQWGASCGGPFGPATLSAPLGGTGAFEVQGAPPGAAALAVFGTSEQATAGLPLPVRLPGGCPLLVALDVTAPTAADATGVARLTFPVPASLPRGFALHAQWLVATPGGLASSSAASVQTAP